MQYRHLLHGCATQPLINYLKALGIARIVGEQADPGARTWWEDTSFYLGSELNEPELLEIFLSSYSPTPVVTPWNGGSGFYGDKKATDYLQAIVKSSDPRWEDYRQTITCCQQLIAQIGMNAKPNNDQKLQLMTLCRAHLPERALQAQDALFVLSIDRKGLEPRLRASYAPLLGSGGNDGNLEFVNTFMRYLQCVLSLNEGDEPKHSRSRLELSLFHRDGPPLLTGPVGQFFPGAGGANSSTGFGDNPLVNPWDFVLAMEGMILFAGSVTRRFSGQQRGMASFPFSVRASAAGWGTLGEADADKDSRGEAWLPLWSRPACLPEIRHLFSEGRIQVRTRLASTGVDVARSIATLGIDRGISSFQRMGFVAGGRNGNMCLAVPLGTFPIRARPEARLLDGLDGWLYSFRSYSTAEGTSTLRAALRRIEEAIFALCLHGGARRVQDLIRALGSANQAISRRRSTFADDASVPTPLMLSSRWIAEADDSSPTFRIAAAVSSIRGLPDRAPGSIRENIEPVVFDRKIGRYTWKDTSNWTKITDLPRTFTAILSRRLQQSRNAAADSPLLAGWLPTTTLDIAHLLTGRLDEHALLELVAGLVCVDYRPEVHFRSRQKTRLDTVDSGYATLKLVFLPGPLTWPPGSTPVLIRTEQLIIQRLVAGQEDEAVRIALRRLKASGFAPLLQTKNVNIMRFQEERQRLSAALLVPVSDVSTLANAVLKNPDPQGGSNS